MVGALEHRRIAQHNGAVQLRADGVGGQGRIISRQPVASELPYWRVHFRWGTRRYAAAALAVSGGRGYHFLYEVRSPGLGLREESSVVPDVSEISPGFEPS